MKKGACVVHLGCRSKVLQAPDHAQALLGVEKSVNFLWVGTTQTWFEPGNPADTSETRARIRSVLDGRFVVYEYEGSLQGKPLLGMAILGYHIDSGRFTMAWIDSFHMGTATMQSEGKVGAEGLSVLGHYEVPGGPPWGWRTEFTLSNNDQFTVTAYNISPEGIESKAVETVYQRERA